MFPQFLYPYFLNLTYDSLYGTLLFNAIKPILVLPW